jgi:hypothetical protein
MRSRFDLRGAPKAATGGVMPDPEMEPETDGRSASVARAQKKIGRKELIAEIGGIARKVEIAQGLDFAGSVAAQSALYRAATFSVVRCRYALRRK